MSNNMYNPGNYNSMASGQMPQTAPAGSVFQVRLMRVTSFLVMTQWRTTVYRGTVEQLEGIARGVTTHNLLFGWWGIPWGLIRTPMALSKNGKAMQEVRAMAAGMNAPQG